MESSLEGSALEVARRRNSTGLNKTLGIRLTRVEDGLVEAVMPITPALFQPFGIVHGGATLSLLESVASAAAEYACDIEVEQPLGVHCDVRHKKSGRTGTLRGVAQLQGRRPSSHLGYYLDFKVTAYDDDDDVISEGIFEVKVMPQDYVAAKAAKAN